MNFLAHQYLSGNDKDLMIGNFIADMVKGKQINGFPAPVVDGIILHRQIDAFTDSHPVVAGSKSRLRRKYRLYAGVVVDMYYDHFLAADWVNYSDYPLKVFASKVYQTLKENHDMLPERAQYVLPYMIDSNWLLSYADTESLHRHFGGMARRTPYASGMEDAVDDLLEHYASFRKEFKLFFPDLMAYVEKLGVSHAHHGA